jgi:hypothetical protein
MLGVTWMSTPAMHRGPQILDRALRYRFHLRVLRDAADDQDELIATETRDRVRGPLIAIKRRATSFSSSSPARWPSESLTSEPVEVEQQQPKRFAVASECAIAPTGRRAARGSAGRSGRRVAIVAERRFAARAPACVPSRPARASDMQVQDLLVLPLAVRALAHCRTRLAERL